MFELFRTAFLEDGFLPLLGTGLLETLYMTVVSTILAYVIGLPLGVAIVVINKEGIYPIPWLSRALETIINLLRSVPFLILMITVMPLAKFIVGTRIGSTATIVPLVIAAAPFVARLVESSIKEVDKGVIEAAQSLGATTFQIIRTMLSEARPALIVGSTIALTTILSYSAMAGIIGGGGLGKIAIQYGYYRYQTGIMLATVVILVIVVQIFQEVGMRYARVGDRRL